MGVGLFKLTSNLSESEPRMTNDRAGFKSNLSYSVPLHDNDQHYRDVRTGLILVQPDVAGRGFVNFLLNVSNRSKARLGLPDLEYQNHASWTSVNGCSLSQSVNRTYFLGAGECV